MTKEEDFKSRDGNKILKRKEAERKIIKINIKRYMCIKNINVLKLSKRAHLNIFRLILILYSPFSTIRLSESIRICKVLELGVSDIV